MTKKEMYQHIAELLEYYPSLRSNNAKLVKQFYRKVYNLSLDEAVEKNGIPTYATIERHIRRVKALYPHYKGHTETEDKFKEIGLEIPLIVKL